MVFKRGAVKRRYRPRRARAITKKGTKSVNKMIYNALSRRLANKRTYATYQSLVTATGAYTAGTWKEASLCASIAQGAGAGQRIGDCINVKYVSFRFYLGTHGHQENIYRHVLSLNNGRDITPLGGISQYERPIYKVDHPDKGIIKILVDKQTTIKPYHFDDADGSIESPVKYVNITYRFPRGLRIKYTGASVDKDIIFSYIATDGAPVIKGGYYRVVWEDA